MSGAAPKDDRILLLTRMVADVVMAILLLAWVVLFLFPEQTDHRFAWTIQPSMTLADYIAIGAAPLAAYRGDRVSAIAAMDGVSEETTRS